MKKWIQLLWLFFAMISSVSGSANSETNDHLIVSANSETYDHLIVSAPDSSIRWRYGDVADIGDIKSFIKIGLIYLTARTPKNDPIETTLTSFGIPSLKFFEIGPLLPALPDVTTVDELRTALQLPESLEGCGSACKEDLGFLKHIIESKLADVDNAKTQWLRTKVLAEMRRLDLTGFGALTGHLARQREFLAQAWGLPPSDLRLLLAMWKRTEHNAALKTEKRSISANLEDEIKWNDLIDVLRKTIKPRRMLRTQVVSHTQPLTIAYIVDIPEQGARDFHGEILVSAADSKPFRIPITAKIVPAKPIIEEILKIVSSPGVMLPLGAIVGYLVFFLQQRYLTKSQEENQFLQNKQQHSRLLQDFFTKRYGALVLPKPQEEDELSQVKNVYRALVAEGFYELMKKSDAKRLNEICSADAQVTNRLQTLDKLLSRIFGEYMPSDAR